MQFKSACGLICVNWEMPKFYSLSFVKSLYRTKHFYNCLDKFMSLHNLAYVLGFGLKDWNLKRKRV